MVIKQKKKATSENTTDAEHITSAKKKCLNATLFNGAVKQFTIV
jgi:hypothetical protein